jgi:phage tail sheath protein FI
MPELLHPGVYTEERRTGVAPIQGVSTSNMGLTGFTPKGPTDLSTLCTSFPQFEAKFGGFNANAQAALHAYAFFANGGRRMYMSRVVPSNALAASGFVASGIAGEAIEVSAGSSTLVGADAGFAISNVTKRITRTDGGNWTTDGFTTGDYVRIASAEDVGNNDIFGPITTVQNVVNGYIEIATATFTTNADDTAAVVTDLKGKAGPDAVGAGFAITGTNTITRNDGGNWTTGGYTITDMILIASAEDVGNNGVKGPLTSVGVGVDGAIALVGGTPLTNNADDTTIVIYAIKTSVGPDAGFAINNGTKRVTRTDGGNWYADGYRIGDYVTIALAEDVGNNGTFGPLATVQNSVNGYIQFDPAVTLVTNADDTTATFVNLKAFAGAIANTPILEGSVEITWRGVGTPLTGEDANESPAPDGAVLDFAGRAVVALGMTIIPGSVTLTTTVAASPYLYTDSAADGILKDSGGDSRGYIDYDTGHWALSAETGQDPDAVSSITVDYTPQGTLYTVVDDGAGNLTGTGLASSGAIAYDTGLYSFTVKASSPAATPANAAILSAAYTQNAITVAPISKGVWGNGLETVVRGDADFFARSTATFSRFDMIVYLDGVQEKVFENLSMTDPTDARYVMSVVNAVGVGSDLITMVDPANGTIYLDTLNGKARSGIGVGSGNGIQLDFGSTDGTGSTPTIPVGFRSAALEAPIQPTSLVISYTDNTGTARTITDDGAGNLVGDDIDPAAPAGYNVVNYTTGAFAFRLLTPISESETSNLATPTGLVPGSVATAAFRLTPASATITNPLSGGSDGTSVDRSVLTSPALFSARKGVYAHLRTNELMNIVVPDAAGSVAMTSDLLTEAVRNEKWFVVVATPPSLEPQEAQEYRRYTLGASTSYGSLYYPYIKITDPLTNLPAYMPPGGHIAGRYAATDISRTVAKSPAGTVDGKLAFATGVERVMEMDELDVLHPYQVNAIVDTPQTGLAIWGSRTLENPPDDYRFVPWRRATNFIKLSIYNSTHGFVFEDVGPGLWSRIRLSLESFMLTLFNDGFFKGTSPTDAFKVVCDESNNPQEVQDAGQVITDIYVAFATPGEFIRFRISRLLQQTA